MTSRIEESALGGLLYDPDLLDRVPLLRPEHFADTRHQTILQTLRTLHTGDPHLRGTPLMEAMAISATLRHPSVPVERLTGLALTSGPPGELAGQATTVIAHAVRREIEASAERIRALTDPLPGKYPFLDYAQLLREMRRYEFSTGPDIDPAMPSRYNGQRPLVRAEEIVVATLIQQPELIGEFADWLPPDAFTTPGRRDLYQAVLAADGLADEPASGFALTEAIRDARRTLFSGAPAELELDQYSSAERADYITHLAQSAVIGTDPAIAGRSLLAALTTGELLDTHTRTHGQDAGLQPHRLHRHQTVTAQQAPEIDQATAAHLAHNHATRLQQSLETSLHITLQQEPPF
jgi:hypothetical protein